MGTVNVPQLEYLILYKYEAFFILVLQILVTYPEDRTVYLQIDLVMLQIISPSPFCKQLVKSHLAHKPCLFYIMKSLNTCLSVLLFVFWTIHLHSFRQSSTFSEKCGLFWPCTSKINYWLFGQSQWAKLIVSHLGS